MWRHLSVKGELALRKTTSQKDRENGKEERHLHAKDDFVSLDPHHVFERELLWIDFSLECLSCLNIYHTHKSQTPFPSCTLCKGYAYD
jgi:hypothetical protein